MKKLRLALVLFGLSLLALVSTVFGMMMAVAADLPKLENAEEFKRSRNSMLVDVRGRELGLLTSPENRILVPSDRIARVMKRAVIAIEDKRYWSHEGVDLRGIARAFIQDVMQRKAVQGGSTIPQQFVKNALKAQAERTVFQKLREAAMAYHLDRRWTKEKILTEYLNAIYFGNGAYGIESAAKTYFGSQPWHQGCGSRDRRCASELRPAEAALLAAVIASPSAYDPVSRPVAAEKRRNLVLRRMFEQELINPVEYRQAIQSSIPRDVQPPRESTKVPYFTTWIKQQVVDRYGPREAFTGGLKIRTTLDLDLQAAAEQAVQRWLGNPAGPTAAVVVIDNASSEVRAMVGGRNYKESPFNLATQGQRQPGSAFKPFILASALQRGIGPGTTWVSKKQQITSKALGCDFEVNNYEDAYAGVTTLASATTNSDNAVYAQVGLKVGVRRIAKLARDMGIRTPVSKNCAMTLGGLREGVTPLDMAHAYQTLATGGQFVTGSLGPDRGPVGIREVCHLNGDGGCDKRTKNKKRVKRVLSQGIAQQANQILSTVIASGTAQRARINEFAAGKTGTTENYGDAWFVGFTKRFTVAVWVGYPNKLIPMTTEYRGEPVAGGTYPAEIWRDFMVSARKLLLERENAKRKKEGKPLLDKDGEEIETTPGVQTTPGPADAAQAEEPAPSPGTRRPEQRRGAGNGKGGGDTEPAPEPERTPQPTPAPAPEGTGGATPGGEAAAPPPD